MNNISRTFTISTTPTRICDIGGWLDTWFAQNGQCFNLSVLSKYFEQNSAFRGIDVLTNIVQGEGNIFIMAADPSFDIQINVSKLIDGTFDKQNLLLATISILPLQNLTNKNLEIRIESPIPPGASMGTSAAIAVCIIKAVLNLNDDDQLKTPQNYAEIAFKSETEVMGGQSGTQDQFSASFSLGAQMINVEQYPRTSLKKIEINQQFQNQLQDGLITVFVGQHNSSKEHLKVIKELESEGQHSHKLNQLRPLPQEAANAIIEQSLIKFGEVMTKNTQAQQYLSSGLVGPKHELVIELSKKHQCLGYKVNGAGGEGGSVSILFEDSIKRKQFYEAAKNELPENFLYFQHIIYDISK